jgi:hypothetical protein
MYLALFKELLDRFQEKTLTFSRKEREGAAIKGNLDWRTITAVKITLNLLAD